MPAARLSQRAAVTVDCSTSGASRHVGAANPRRRGGLGERRRIMFDASVDTGDGERDCGEARNRDGALHQRHDNQRFLKVCASCRKTLGVLALEL